MAIVGQQTRKIHVRKYIEHNNCAAERHRFHGRCRMTGDENVGERKALVERLAGDYRGVVRKAKLRDPRAVQLLLVLPCVRLQLHNRHDTLETATGKTLE